MLTVAALHARAEEAATVAKVNVGEHLEQLAQVRSAGSLYSGPEHPPGQVPVGGGSFPRSFLIPGTDTSLRIGGAVIASLDYWFTGGPPNAAPPTSNLGSGGQLAVIPLDVHGQIVKGVPVPVQVARYRSHAIFSQSFRESRLEFETRTPTIFGEARVFAQLDWFGGGSFLPEGANPLTSVGAATPRLRSAFGTLGGLLAGQALSNFRDFDAFPKPWISAAIPG